MDTEYTYYSWCVTSTDIVKWRKNEWLWKFWKRNDLYENFEKRGVVEKRGEEETKSMPHAPVVLVEKLWTQNTRIIHDVWRLLILSNEEKTNDYENFEKGMIYMKILKKGGGSREKGGGGNEIHAPCACDKNQYHL